MTRQRSHGQRNRVPRNLELALGGAPRHTRGWKRRTWRRPLRSRDGYYNGDGAAAGEALPVVPGNGRRQRVLVSGAARWGSHSRSKLRLRFLFSAGQAFRERAAAAAVRALGCSMNPRDEEKAERRKRERGGLGPRGWVWGCECVVVTTLYFLHSKHYPWL
jgi:hypothetical protein